MLLLYLFWEGGEKAVFIRKGQFRIELFTLKLITMDLLQSYVTFSIGCGDPSVIITHSRELKKKTSATKSKRVLSSVMHCQNMAF